MNVGVFVYLFDLVFLSPQEVCWGLKTILVVAKLCNYNVTWCTGAKKDFSRKLTMWNKRVKTNSGYIPLSKPS